MNLIINLNPPISTNNFIVSGFFTMYVPISDIADVKIAGDSRLKEDSQAKQNNSNHSFFLNTLDDLSIANHLINNKNWFIAIKI